MKSTIKILMAAAAVAGLAACTDNPEYKSVPFVSLDRASVEVEESDPATLLTIPVRVYNNKSGCTVTYTVTDVSAVAGTDYTLVDDSGVLTFAAGEDSLAVQLSITGQPGTFTGSRTLVVELGTANNGVTLGSLSACQVSIKDLDHPLADMFGAYSMEGVAYYSSSSAAGYYIWDWTMNMTAYDGDATRVWLDNIVFFSSSDGYGSYTGDCPVYGVVSDDHKTITVPLPQRTTGDLSAFGYDYAWMYYHDGSNYVTTDKDVVFTLDESTGVWSTTDGYGISHPDDLEDYPDSFYPLAVMYSGRYSSYPTTFVKN